MKRLCYRSSLVMEYPARVTEEAAAKLIDDEPEDDVYDRVCCFHVCAHAACDGHGYRFEPQF